MYVQKENSTRNSDRESAERAESHVSRHREPNLQDFGSVFKEAVTAKLRDQNDGKSVLWPSLAQIDEDISIDGLLRESEIGRPVRVKEPSGKRLCEQEVRAERAIQSKYKRSGQLGELRKHLNRVQECIERFQDRCNGTRRWCS